MSEQSRYIINTESLNAIPTDKLETFFQQFSTAYIAARLQCEALTSLAKVAGIEASQVVSEPAHFTWIDDGLTDIQINVHGVDASGKRDGSVLRTEIKQVEGK